MDVRDEHIPVETFGTCTELLPQVCVELFVEHDDGVVVTKRTNDPAKGEWFWPGSRLYKGERLTAAAHRVASQELGIAIEIKAQLGVYSHFWETSSLPGSPTRHTVNVVYRVRPTATEIDVQLDDQHSDWRLLTEREADLHQYVHRYIDDSGIFA